MATVRLTGTTMKNFTGGHWLGLAMLLDWKMVILF